MLLKVHLLHHRAVSPFRQTGPSYRRAARHGIAIVARGQVERKDMVVHIMVNRIDDISGEIAALTSGSRDFH